MVEQLFAPAKVERIRRSWLGTSIERYIEWLVERQYSRKSTDDRVPVLIHFGEFARRRGARRIEDLPSHVDAFVSHWVGRVGRQGPGARRCAAQKARAFVEQMVRLVVAGFRGGRWPKLEWPFRAAAPGFPAHLRDERGLSPQTIWLYGHYLRQLEAYMTEMGLGLVDLSPGRLSDFMVEISKRVGRGSMVCCTGVLRTFLRFAEREGLVAGNLARSVDRPRIYRLARVPRSISWADAARLLERVDRTRAVGKRDHAILLLLVVYGLRAREVAALTLDDVDWSRERVQIPQRKGGHSHLYPLSAPVGEALLEYLRFARPRSSDRHVFLQVKAPYTALRFIDVSRRASHHLRQAGIVVPRAGSHTLRHTCVQRLVDAGFSLKAIGDFVGHRVPESTQIYAKVAIEALREVARDRGEAAL
jgi:site-specific recombinase XerD